MLLSREILATRPSLAAAVAVSAIAGAASLALAMRAPARFVAEGALGEVAIATPLPRATELRLDADAARVIEYGLLMRAGTTTYMQIGGDAARAVAQADARRLHAVPDTDASGVHVAIASLELSELPSELSALQGRRMRIDDRCDATITGFAIVSRLVGTPEYAGVEGPWTPESIFEHGVRTLAAELSGCAGRYARDARLPPLVRATDIEDEDEGYAIQQAARTRLLSSPRAIEVQQEWTEYRDSLRRYHDEGDDEEDNEERWFDSTDAEIEVVVVKHPTTNATWAVAHARLDGGCGLPEAKLVAVYEVALDGQLTPIPQLSSELMSIQEVIDLDNDGRFELVGKDWLGNTVVARDSGATIDKLDVAFWACGC